MFVILVEITVRGPIDQISGMVMNINDFKNIIQFAILDQLDHKDIDKDVPYFLENNIVSTTENLVIFMWNNLQNALKTLSDSVKLHKIRIKETDKNFVTYKGE